MTKLLFIGGFTSSGTTAVRHALAACGFAKTTDPYMEGQRDPKHPKPWYPPGDAFKQWVENWIADEPEWFMEKSPGRYLYFREMQALWPEAAHFIMLQRDPFETVASNQRRWPDQYPHRRGTDYQTISHDHEGMLLRLRGAIELHQHRDELQRFCYVRYEAMCREPVRTLASTLAALGIEVPGEAVNAAARSIRRPRRYPSLRVARSAPETLALCNELAGFWGYRARRFDGGR